MNYLDVARMMKIARDFYAEELEREEQLEEAKTNAILAQARNQGIPVGDNYTITGNNGSYAVNGQPVNPPQSGNRVVSITQGWIGPDDPRFAEIQAKMDAAKMRQIQAQRASTPAPTPAAPQPAASVTTAPPAKSAVTTLAAPPQQTGKPAVVRPQTTSSVAKPATAPQARSTTAPITRPQPQPTTPLKPPAPIKSGQRLATTTRPSPGPRK